MSQIPAILCVSIRIFFVSWHACTRRSRKPHSRGSTLGNAAMKQPHENRLVILHQHRLSTVHHCPSLSQFGEISLPHLHQIRRITRVKHICQLSRDLLLLFRRRFESSMIRTTSTLCRAMANSFRIGSEMAALAASTTSSAASTPREIQSTTSSGRQYHRGFSLNESYIFRRGVLLEVPLRVCRECIPGAGFPRWRVSSSSVNCSMLDFSSSSHRVNLICSLSWCWTSCRNSLSETIMLTK